MDISKKIEMIVKEKLGLKNLPDSSFKLIGCDNSFDSTSLLEFIIELEDEFGIIVADEDLVPDNFETIESVINYIKSCIEE